MLLRKLGLLYEFCQQTARHCFQFLQQDPIEQSSQIQSFYQSTQMKKQQLKQDYGDLEDQDIDHQLIEQENPFEKLKPTLNFQNAIPQQNNANLLIEKEQIKYDEEMVDIHQNSNWNNNELDHENEHIEL